MSWTLGPALKKVIKYGLPAGTLDAIYSISNGDPEPLRAILLTAAPFVINVSVEVVFPWILRKFDLISLWFLLVAAMVAVTGCATGPVVFDEDLKYYPDGQMASSKTLVTVKPMNFLSKMQQITSFQYIGPVYDEEGNMISPWQLLMNQDHRSDATEVPLRAFQTIDNVTGMAPAIIKEINAGRQTEVEVEPIEPTE